MASRELVALMAVGADIQKRAYAIETYEKRADKITQGTIELLHKTFITPLDRDEIHQLVTKMDDILDLTEDCAQSMVMYDVREITPEARALADLCLQCSIKVKECVSLLSSMENAAKMMELCHDIDKLESEADHVMRDAMAKLFRDEPDVRQLIKLRSIYEILEEVTDRAEDVANIIQIGRAHV